MIVNPTLPANGDSAYVDAYNAAFNALTTVINGNIDQDNLAANSVITTKILDAAVASAKIAAAAVTTDKIADAAVTAAKMEAQQAWIAPTMQNGWITFDTTFNPPGYYKDSLGIVHLRGMMKSGTLNVTAFTLPVGYRPAFKVLMATISNQALGRLDVTTDGMVIPNMGSNIYFTLDNLRFKAEA